MSFDDLPPLGPAPEDLETRALRWQTARKLFGAHAPDLMKIGRFELLEELGTGGQGTVYEARDPELDRRVAIKRLAMADAEHRERMRREGRALARVAHPNVVQIYEVGEDETERPYLVMELVEGEPLDRWLLEAPRHWTEVVALMAAVGDGLAAIHEAKVMHRDVKPHNIVIQENGRATLIDLGIAVLDASEAEPAEPDGAGTVGYIAPEGYGGRFDARSDQFGFCVTLYEALFGVRPPRAMTRSESLVSGRSSGSWLGGVVGSGSATDQTERCGRPVVAAVGLEEAPRRLRDVLARGMQDDPARRYDDMPALVAALRDVLPRPPRWSLAAMAGLLVVGTAAGVGAGLWQGSSSDPCEVTRPAGALWSDEVQRAVRESFARADPSVAAQTFATVDAMVSDTTGALDGRWVEACRLPDQARPMGLADLHARHGELGAIIDSLDEVEGAGLSEVPVRLSGPLERLRGWEPKDACEQSEVMLGAPESLRAVEDTRRRAVAQAVVGHYDAALASATEALEQAAGPGMELVQARLLLERGRLALEAMQLDAAVADLEAARSRAEALGCDRLGARALILYVKAELAEGHGSLDKAELASQVALDKLDRLSVEGPRRAQALKSRGLELQRRRDYSAAVEHYERALAIWEGSDPPAPLDVTDAMLNLAITKAHQGHQEEAVAILKQAIEIRESALWPEHPSLYKLHATLSYRYLEQGDLLASEQALSRALTLATQGLGAQHPRVATLQIAMARVLDHQHDFDAALRHAELADEILAQAHGERDLRRIDALEAIGQVHMNAGAPDRAIPVLRESLEIQAGSAKATAWGLAIGRGKLARAHARSGDHEAALVLYGQARQVLEADPTRRGDPFVPELLMGWGEALVATGQPAEAVAPLTEAEARWASDGTNPERLAHTRWWLAQALCPTDPQQASTRAREALRWFESMDTQSARRMRGEVSRWLERGCPVAP